ncbi:hypothetical protein LTR85_011742 [Meristemomyces frigidus]|nr:hypothetical protein LTR85_011742 [Meristemomyces frigidus]
MGPAGSLRKRKARETEGAATVARKPKRRREQQPERSAPVLRLPEAKPEEPSNFVRFVEQSQFMRVEEIPDGLSLGDLDNPILPIFKRENFPHVSESEYQEVLTIPLRLASLMSDADMLRSNSVLATVVASSHSTVNMHEPLLNGTQQYVYQQPNGNQHTKRRLVETRFDCLQHILRFHASDDRASGAETEAVVPLEGVPPEDAQEWPSIVHYSRKHFNELVKQTRSGKDPAYLLLVRWEFAWTIAHEVVHALTYAQNWVGQDDGLDKEVYNEIYFDADPEKAPIAECGYEFEVRQVGGHITRLYRGHRRLKKERLHRYKYSNGSFSAIEGVMVMWEWPCVNLCNHYAESGFPMGVRKNAYLRRLDVAWRIPLQYFAELFTQGFWQKVFQQIRESGISDLHPPREVGHCFSDERGTTNPVSLPPLGMAEYVPAGYQYISTNDIVLTQMHRSRLEERHGRSDSAIAMPEGVLDTVMSERTSSNRTKEALGTLDCEMELWQAAEMSASEDHNNGDGSESLDDDTEDEDSAAPMPTALWRANEASKRTPSAFRKDYNAFAAEYVRRWPPRLRSK